MTELATKTTWQNHPIDDPKLIQIDLHFTDQQFSKLIIGLIPEQMEDKWFIFYENDWLYFHRSWTGFGIYKAQLKKETDGYSIKRFWAERSEEKYNNEDDNADIENFSFLIARGLLGNDVNQIYASQNIKSDSDLVKGISDFGKLLYSNQGVNYSDKIKSVLFGIAVGDAVGVPFEFSSRKQMTQHPASDMIGYGTHNQPPGTWSDDSSLTFCLAEAITNNGYDLPSMAFNFYRWKKDAWWAARKEVFDIGITTSQAITRLHDILETSDDFKELKQLKFSGNEYDNGNGSLMRIAPLLFYIEGMPPLQQFEIIWDVSALTHRHIRAAMSCFIYLNLAEKLLNGQDKFTAYAEMRKSVLVLWEEIKFPVEEQEHFLRLIQNDITETKIDHLKSGGYVIEVLESSIWFFLQENNYRETILSIINIGHDTDTSAAIAGGLAGLHYGFDGIPKEWTNQIARKKDIENLAERLGDKIALH